jgi:hypothetical protein
MHLDGSLHGTKSPRILQKGMMLPVCDASVFR